MNLQVAPDQVMCRAFPQMLTNTARDWFSTLEPNSIASFSDLADKFSVFFASSKRIRKTAASLMCEEFKMSLSKTPPTSVTDLLTRAEKYINMEETMFPKRDAPPSAKPKLKRQHELNLHQDQPRGKTRHDNPSAAFTRLNTTRSNILMEINDMKELKWLSRMKSSSKPRDMNKYCEFHQDHGHTIETCKALLREIESLIKRGFLGASVGQDKRSRNDLNKANTSGTGDSNGPTVGTINVIV
ncbi:uncharacterized protein LOC111400437 [Olea europaea var. sylvestris]|uniref:uncharacterized protein LOC111400437 n=1 Tax=Olea europaea var. sylvestris TaxID=158386 RepID=UPI000C1CCE85|nr:uncharacterized protein LOC111400437 [Olea europaea var. sylvestris]